MPSNFTQHPHDPEPRFSVGEILALPIAILFGICIVYAAKFGHRRASDLLDVQSNPAAANESPSATFVFDPGEEPIVFALELESLRDRFSAPPGSVGSGTVVESKPVLLRITERDGEFVRVIVDDGLRKGERYWTKDARLLEAKRDGGKQ